VFTVSSSYSGLEANIDGRACLVSRRLDGINRMSNEAIKWEAGFQDRLDSNLGRPEIPRPLRSRLGRFQRMSYIVEFNASGEDIERSLDEQLHILSIELATGKTRDEALADFFDDILNRIDINTGERLRRSAPDIFEPLGKNTLERTYENSDASRLFESSSTLCLC
jgi:hypothetical protein